MGGKWDNLFLSSRISLTILASFMSSGVINPAQRASLWLGLSPSHVVSGQLTVAQGHEFTGTVEEVGPEVKNFNKGDQVVSPFTVSWSAKHPSKNIKVLLIRCSGECFYCKKGFTSRCAKSRLFGTAALDGAQAEYVCDLT